ncbi:MAG: SdpI family protein [Pseudomonadota bacterium]
MNRKTANTISLSLIALAGIASALAYPGMADTVPTHWNASGQADGFSSKLTGVLIGPLSALGICVLMWVIPLISPKGFRTEGFASIINIFQVALVVFMLGIGGIIILAGYGHDASVEKVVPMAVGALFIVLGNYMAKIRKNFFVGIRTPWTLASDEVWAKTHRLGGYSFVIGGVIMVVTPLLGLGHIVFTAVALTAGMLPVAYSFFAYKRIEGFGDE